MPPCSALSSHQTERAMGRQDCDFAAPIPGHCAPEGGTDGTTSASVRSVFREGGTCDNRTVRERHRKISVRT